ncbi:MAG: methyl-accepting chemotaxis protein [Propionivibrio sp.]
MISFERMGVRARLTVAGIVVLIGLVVMAAYTLMQIRTDAMNAHSERIKHLVEVSTGIVAEYQKLEADKKMTREEAQAAAKEALRTPRFNTNDYYFIYDFDGRAVMVAGNSKMEGEVFIGKTDTKGFKLWDAFVAAGKAGSGYIDYWFPRAGATESSQKRAYVVGIPDWKWIVGTGVYVDDVDVVVTQAAIRYALISLVILAIVSFVGIMVARSIVRQLGGEPAAAIDLMSRAAAGDLTVRVNSSAKGSILDSAAQMLGSIRTMVSEINDSSVRLAKGAENISAASREVAVAAGSQNDATQSMAAAIEEMTVSVRHISDSAHDTERESSQSVELADDGFGRIQSASREINEIATTVNDASTRIHKLEERANQISSIAGVIKDIAGQTNLLALNAAIEAARAGEQGRGFAVVADEVRKLAERTSMATIEIEQMISGIQSETVLVVGAMSSALPQVEAGVKAAEGAAESLRRIKDGAESTLARIREVASATKEQSEASTSIAQRVEQISQMVEETTVAMHSTAATAEDMEKISSELSGLISRFRC